MRIGFEIRIETDIGRGHDLDRELGGADQIIGSDVGLHYLQTHQPRLDLAELGEILFSGLVGPGRGIRPKRVGDKRPETFIVHLVVQKAQLAVPAQGLTRAFSVRAPEVLGGVEPERRINGINVVVASGVLE